MHNAFVVKKGNPCRCPHYFRRIKLNLENAYRRSIPLERGNFKFIVRLKFPVNSLGVFAPEMGADFTRGIIHDKPSVLR